MLPADDVVVVVLLAAVVGAERGDGQTGAGHGDEDVVHVLDLVVLHDQLAVDRVHRLRAGVGDDHVARRTLHLTPRAHAHRLVVLRHGARDLVLVGGHGAPHVLLAYTLRHRRGLTDPRVLLQRLGEAQHLDAVLERLVLLHHLVALPVLAAVHVYASRRRRARTRVRHVDLHHAALLRCLHGRRRRLRQEGVIRDALHRCQQRPRLRLLLHVGVCLIVHTPIGLADRLRGTVQEGVELGGALALQLLVDDYASARGQTPTGVTLLLGAGVAPAVAGDVAEIARNYGKGGGALEAVLLNDVEEHLLVARADHAPVDQHVRLRSVHVLQDAARVRDDYESLAGWRRTDGGGADAVDVAVLQGRQRLAQHAHRFQINAALRLVQHGEHGLLEQQLEGLAALALTTGKADVQVAIQVIGHCGGCTHFLHVYASPQIRSGTFLVALLERRRDESLQRQSLNLGRTLEEHSHAHDGALRNLQSHGKHSALRSYS